MKFERSCGILLHITSLPGRHGIGTMGREAYEFADFLKRSGQSYWQILPTGPVCADIEYSPYGSTSTFAGNPLFINTDTFAGKEMGSLRRSSRAGNIRSCALCRFRESRTVGFREDDCGVRGVSESRTC